MDTLSLLTPAAWQDYELIDSGNREKLERFGAWTLRRPEPQAIWEKSLPEKEWASANAVFRKTGEEKGEWQLAPGMPGQWHVGYKYKDMSLRMRLGLTSFKHVGLFPEQAANWEYIYDKVRQRGGGKVLNLFAYTGGASLAACAAGAEVTHVDSVKQVVSWSRENMEASGLDGIRWIVDDAAKFVQRELRRGNLYDGVILDPPAYGRGPDGEKWVLEEGLGELMRGCAGLLCPGGFLVLNLYSMGLSALLAQGLAEQALSGVDNPQAGELFVTDRSGKRLPLGVFFRGEKRK